MDQLRSNKKPIVFFLPNAEGKTTHMFIKAGDAYVNRENLVVAFTADVSDAAKEKKFVLCSRDTTVDKALRAVKDYVIPVASSVIIGRYFWNKHKDQKKPGKTDNSRFHTDKHSIEGSLAGMGLATIAGYLEKKVGEPNLCYRYADTDEIALVGFIKVGPDSL